MKAYRIVLLVVDHDHLGVDAITDNIENVRYPNRCISPRVMAIEEKDIGEWTDAHPLNQTATQENAFAKIFSDLFKDRP